MKVLVACERSGVVRDAFIARGHDALSCDLEPTDSPGPHYRGDVRDILDYPWDLMIAHPPCTHLSVSGARHFAEKRMDGRQHAAVSFFMALAKADIPRIAIENPVCIMSSLWRKPDQVIQPWQFGHGETKATCLWLKGLLLLRPTNIVEGRDDRIHKMSPSEDRARLRSVTYQGVGDAMAAQWTECDMREMTAEEAHPAHRGWVCKPCGKYQLGTRPQCMLHAKEARTSVEPSTSSTIDADGRAQSVK